VIRAIPLAVETKGTTHDRAPPPRHHRDRGTVSGRIHFVRHAETLFNVNGQLQGWCDSPLTARGDAQAAALGERMRDVPLAAAFMSDLTRTRTTMAAALAGHPHLEPVPLRELREWHFGGWEGLPNAALWGPVFARLGHTYEPRSAAWAAIAASGFDGVIDAIHEVDPLGRAETGADVSARISVALGAVIAASEEAAVRGTGDVIVVTHGSVLGSLLRAIAPESRPPMGIPNCGIVSVSWQDGTATLSDVDATCA
jgi:probable phosphoglycerate mutase